MRLSDCSAKLRPQKILNFADCRIENVMEITPDKPCGVNRRRAQDENGGAQLKRGVK